MFLRFCKPLCVILCVCVCVFVSDMTLGQRVSGDTDPTIMTPQRRRVSRRLGGHILT